MTPNNTPVALISEKDEARIVQTLFKMKLLALFSEVAALIGWNFP